MVQLMDKDLFGGTSSTRSNWLSLGPTWLRSCTQIKSKYQISLWSIPQIGLSIQFTAGLIKFSLFVIKFLKTAYSLVCFIILIKLYIFSNIIVKGLTILAPVDSPNTDGINPGKKIVSFLLYTYFHLHFEIYAVKMSIFIHINEFWSLELALIIPNFSLLHRFMHKH